MKRGALMTMMAVAGIASMAVAPAATHATVPTEQQAVEERAARKMRKAVAAGSLAPLRRSRGPQAKPKRRSNRLHTSKRARRKHRRAA